MPFSMTAENSCKVTENNDHLGPAKDKMDEGGSAGTREARKKALDLQNKVKEETGIEIKGLVDADYSEVVGRCCENIVGMRTVPTGISNRSVIINSHRFFIPVCTTEGALVASMCRGIKLINECGGVSGYTENLGITRSFTMRFRDFREAMGFYTWMKKGENTELLKTAGNRGSRHTRIKSIESRHVVGDEVYLKVYAFTGDAMGMNMVTKACNQIAAEIRALFPGTELACISSNMCTDKKWSVENYCNGRGRRVFMSLRIPQDLCLRILKVSVDQVLGVYHTKVVVGSALVLGSANCQAANYVAGTFLALGQDLGQLIESSNCVVSMKKSASGALDVSLYMPSVVVGVLGGGTHLEPARSFLRQFDVPDSEFIITDREQDKSCAPGYLALTIGAAVLAGELSVMASLADNTLMAAHLALNRRK
jgi:hydroxymethylglutaryl-CoA reductase (NADPH)